jgi:hypothetical protein
VRGPGRWGSPTGPANLGDCLDRATRPEPDRRVPSSR